MAEVARLLVAAENPVIVAGRLARTQKGIDLLVELAETVQAPVIDQRNRMNFPSKHPLYGAGNVGQADLVLGLEVQDFYGSESSRDARESESPGIIIPVDWQRQSKADQHLGAGSQSAQQLSGFRALCRSSIWQSRPTAKPRCRR